MSKDITKYIDPESPHKEDWAVRYPNIEYNQSDLGGLVLALGDGVSTENGYLAANYINSRFRYGFYKQIIIPEMLYKAFQDVFNRINAELHEPVYIQAHAASTYVLLVWEGKNKAHIDHAGDSRAYRVRDGRLEQLTQDDDAPSNGPSAIKNALGFREKLRKTSRKIDVKKGDIYLLLSDGYTNNVSNPELLEISLHARNSANFVDLLNEKINEKREKNKGVKYPDFNDDDRSIIVWYAGEEVPERKPGLLGSFLASF